MDVIIGVSLFIVGIVALAYHICNLYDVGVDFELNDEDVE